MEVNRNDKIYGVATTLLSEGLNRLPATAKLDEACSAVYGGVMIPFTFTLELARDLNKIMLWYLS